MGQRQRGEALRRHRQRHDRADPRPRPVPGATAWTDRCTRFGGRSHGTVGHRRWRGRRWKGTARRSSRSPSTGAPPAAAATWRSSTPTSSSSTWPRSPTSVSGRSRSTASTTTSRPWPTASSTSPSSTARSATPRTSTSRSCSAGRASSWSPSAPAPTWGGSPGSANQVTKEEILSRAYLDNPSIEPGNRTVPRPSTQVEAGVLEIPEFYQRVYKLDDIVEVDYYVPGCPPAPAQVKAVLLAVVTGALPPKGSVVGASERAVCDDCKREKQEKKVQQVLPALGDHPGLRQVPAGAGDRLRRIGHPLRLRRPLPRQRHALPRLLRPAPERARPGRQAGQRHRLDHRQQGPGGDRSHPGRHPRHHGVRLPVRAARHPSCRGASDMARTIKIDPITRLEGHGKIEIFLDDDGGVKDCYFQIPELRGFERFVVGRPIEELPRIVTRICGVCPASHHLAARQGRRRLLRRRVPAARPQAARDVLPGALHPQPHRPLLRPGRPRLRLRPGRRPGGAEHPRAWWPRSGSRSAAGSSGSRAMAQEIQQIIGGRFTHLVWCLPGGVSKGLKPEELDADQADGGRAVRLRPVLAAALPGRHPGQPRLRRSHPQRPLHARRPEHGAGGREQRAQLLPTARCASSTSRARRSAATRRASTTSTWPSTSSRGPTSSSPT